MTDKKRNSGMGDLPEGERVGKTVGPESGAKILRRQRQQLSNRPITFNGIVFVNAGRKVGTESTQVLQDNPNRQYILIQNNSGGNIFLGFGTKADLFNGVKIVPGGNYEPYLSPRSAIHILASVANSNVVIVEGYGSK